MEHTFRISYSCFFIYSILYLPRVEPFSDCGGIENRYVCDVSNPQAFHICLDGNRHSLACPSTLHFNARTQICDWPGTTYCPYDNYSGEDDDTDAEPEDDFIINDEFEDSSYQSISSAAASADRAPQSHVRVVNPYANLYNKDLYHGYDSGKDEITATPRHVPLTSNKNLNHGNDFAKGKRRKVIVHDYRRGTLDEDADDDIVENDGEREIVPTDLYTNGMTEDHSQPEGSEEEGHGYNLSRKQMNVRSPYVHSYRRDYDREKSEDAVDTHGNVLSKGDDVDVMSQQHTNAYLFDEHVNGFGSDKNAPVVSYIVTKKLRKGRRKAKFLSRKGVDSQDENRKSDYIYNQPKRPRSLSPFAPPSEAYNIYSFLKRDGHKNSVSDKHQDYRSQPGPRLETNSRPMSMEKNHKWYEPAVATTSDGKSMANQNQVSDDIMHTDDEYFENRQPNQPEKEAISLPTSPFADSDNIYLGDDYFENQELSQPAKESVPAPTSPFSKTAPSWINRFEEDERNALTNDRDMAIDPDDDDDSDNGQRKHHVRRAQKFPFSTNLRQRPSNSNSRYYTQSITRPFNDVNEQPRSIPMNSFRAARLNNNRDPDTNRAWMASEINNSQRPVWHPRIRPYGPWPLSDLVVEAVQVNDESTKTSKTPSQLTPKIPAPSKMRPVSAISFSGSVIHPYKPKQYGVDETAPLPWKKTSSYSSDRKSNPAKSWTSTKRRGKCSSSWCQLPECRCVGPDIPGSLAREDVPMMVMLTFDDGVNQINFPYYEQIFGGSLRNPNGCPVKSTFFVSGDSTDYELVKHISKAGHEVASHTMSHRNPTTWWSHAGVENWENEVVGMKNLLAQKSNVPRDSIQGMRAPFLQIGGDGQYTMLFNNKFRYDSSMVTGSLYKDGHPPIWPFTLDTPPDYKTCNLTPCPTKPYPGLWEVPLIRWYGNDGVACAMPDSCNTGFGLKGTQSFLEENFQRHNTSNRAPLGIFIHASWFKRKSENFEALKNFLSSILKNKDVWILTASQVLDWIEHPVPVSSLDKIRSWQC